MGPEEAPLRLEGDERVEIGERLHGGANDISRAWA
jgi:hypothetical protein